MSATKSAEVRARLDHPVIDSDGHTIEFEPAVMDYLEKLAGASMVERYRRSSGDGLMEWKLSDVERRAQRMGRAPWWMVPAENTLDRATASLPRLFAARLEELGIDFSVVYPSIGLVAIGFADPELRQASCRAFNEYHADLYREHAKCLAPELRGFRFPDNVHRIPEYMGSGQEEKTRRIGEIIEIARSHGYTHLFAGYGFMAEDAEFVRAIEASGLKFMGPSSHVADGAGAKDQAKKLARSIGVSVTPGVDNPSALALVRKAGGLAGLQKIAKGIKPVIDSEIKVADFGQGLERLETRRVFGKIVVRF